MLAYCKWSKIRHVETREEFAADLPGRTQKCWRHSLMFRPISEHRVICAVVRSLSLSLKLPDIVAVVLGL